MDELEINQLDSEAGLFDDYVAEDTPEVTEETTDVEETPTESTGEEPTEQVEEVPQSFLNIKFNGEEKFLTEDEARTLAQKGMNYDRFYEPIERLARMNNMSVGDYVNQLNDTQFQYELSKTMDELREDPKYENVNDEVLEEIAKTRVENLIGERDKYYADQQKEQADAQEEAVKRDVDKFLEEYPEYKDKGPDALDPKVFEYTKKGYTLLEAYNKFQRESVKQSQIEAQAKASKLNEENKKKSLGSTTNAGSVEADPFLRGFLEN